MRMSKFALFGLAVAVILTLAALPAAAQNNRDTTNDKWEVSTFFGGAWGHKFGGPSLDCTPIAQSPFNPNGCDLSFMRPPNDTVWEEFFQQPSSLFPDLQVNGFLRPQNGPAWGARAGVDFTPTWQGEFIFIYGAADLAWSPDPRTIIDGITAACLSDGDCSPDHDNIFALDSGNPTGNQQTYLLNLNYHFDPNARIVPYVGGGFGWQKWYNGPNVVIVEEDHDDFFFATKSSGRDNTLALDAVGGVKIHATPAFGVRLEVMNIVSWPQFRHEHLTVDISGDAICCPGGNASSPGEIVSLTGNTKQRSVYNLTIFNAGVFYRW